jgi:hypothetical protein
MSPLLIIMLGSNFVLLAVRKFAAVLVRDGALQVVGVTIKSIPLENLVAMEVSPILLVFVARDGAKLECGRLGILDSVEAIREGLRGVKPDIEVRRVERVHS